MAFADDDDSAAHARIVEMFGGVKAFAEHWIATYVAINPDNPLRDKLLADFVKLMEASK